MSGLGRTPSKTTASSSCSSARSASPAADDARVRDEQRAGDAELARRSRRAARSRRHRARAASAPRRCGSSRPRRACVSSLRGRGDREALLSPVLGVGQIVEREDMEAGDVALGIEKALSEPCDQGIGTEAARAKCVREPAAMAVQEPSRRAESDRRRDRAAALCGALRPGSRCRWEGACRGSIPGRTQLAVTAGSKQIWLTM